MSFEIFETQDSEYGKLVLSVLEATVESHDWETFGTRRLDETARQEVDQWDLSQYNQIIPLYTEDYTLLTQAEEDSEDYGPFNTPFDFVMVNVYIRLQNSVSFAIDSLKSQIEDLVCPVCDSVDPDIKYDKGDLVFTCWDDECGAQFDLDGFEL